MLLIEESILNREMSSNYIGSLSSPSVLVATKGAKKPEGDCNEHNLDYAPKYGLALEPKIQTWVQHITDTGGSLRVLSPTPHHMPTGQAYHFSSEAAFGLTGPPIPTGFCYPPSGPRVDYGLDVMYTTLLKAFNTMALGDVG
nr:hypothetical protein [Tanacetum cinerariifolium]